MRLKQLLIIAFCISLKGYSQQIPQYTQYMYNPISINPAYSGTNQTLEGTILHRSQWVGIEGAPITQTLTLNGLLGDNIGLGFNLYNDKIGPSKQVEFKGTFSYHLQLTDNMRIALGINGGLDLFNVDWSEGIYYDQQDASFNDDIREARPVFGVGTFLFGDNWYVGLSTPNFIVSNFYDDDQEEVLSREVHYYVIAGYVFNVSHALKFKPGLLTKVVSGAPITLDFSANFLIHDKITVGASYRSGDSLSGLAGFQLSEGLFLGYSYDYTTTALSKYNSGSHELILRYSLSNRNKRARSPRFF